MSEVLGVKRREALAIVDGLAYDEHRGESQLVVVDNLRQVLELATIDLLVRPCKMIAGGYGGVLWVLLKEFALHIVDDGGREEDTHRTLTFRQQVQLFFLRHRGAPFASCEDNRLCALWYRELTPQLCRSGEERRDAWRDVIRHALLVEERHLFLNGSEDTRIARMQTNDEMPLVVVLLHQLALFLKVHIRR